MLLILTVLAVSTHAWSLRPASWSCVPYARSPSPVPPHAWFPVPCPSSCLVPGPLSLLMPGSRSPVPSHAWFRSPVPPHAWFPVPCPSSCLVPGPLSLPHGSPSRVLMPDSGSLVPHAESLVPCPSCLVPRFLSLMPGPLFLVPHLMSALCRVSHPSSRVFFHFLSFLGLCHCPLPLLLPQLRERRP
eukprot:jgi/Botrbrau1/12462/Bobra.0169s0010.1